MAPKKRLADRFAHKELEVRIPDPQFVLLHDDEITHKHDASPSTKARVRKQYREEHPLPSDLSGKNHTHANILYTPPSTSGDGHHERDLSRAARANADTSSSSDTLSNEQATATPRIDQVLAMMRARRQRREQEATAAAVAPTLPDVEDESEVTHIDVRQSLVVEEALSSPDGSYARAMADEEDCSADDMSLEPRPPPPTLAHAVVRTLPAPTLVTVVTSSSPPASPPSRTTIPELALESAFRNLRGLATRARRQPPAHGLAARQHDLLKRQQQRDAAQAVKDSELIARLRSAVIANMTIQHKVRGQARATNLLAPRTQRGTAGQFLSRKRQRSCIQRFGKERLATLADKHSLVRRAFAALLMDAYDDYSDAEDDDGPQGEDHGDEAIEETEGEQEEVVGTAAEPVEWVYGLDDQGRPYYFNQRTGHSSWEAPLFSTADGTWVRRMDEQNRYFWYNEASGASNWELPPEEYEAD
jgi:hypothetical protein